MINPLELQSADPVEILLHEEQLKLVKKVNSWKAAKPVFLPVLNALDKLGIQPTGIDYYIAFSVAGDAELLTKIVRILRTSGFITTAERPKKGENTWYAFFNYEGLTLSIFLSFTSTVCRRVKVGTKMVEQDVYEVQCGDLAESLPPAGESSLAEQIPF